MTAAALGEEGMSQIARNPLAVALPSSALSREK